MIKVENSSIFKWEVRGVLRLKLRDEITQNLSLSLWLTREQENAGSENLGCMPMADHFPLSSG